jgi:beta-lactamase class A
VRFALPALTLLAAAGILLSAAEPSPFKVLEARMGGRLGVRAVDTGTGRVLAWRDGQRFRMCSTFKLLLAAQVLQRVDRGQERLDRVLPYGKGDLLPYAPVTARHVAEGGMTIGDLCAAMVTTSDNTAANLLLAASGGPRAFTAFARSLGDPVTRLDRNEPSLNRASGDLDTTTPRAMADDVREVVLGQALSPASRSRLEGWLLGNTVGDARLRAGVPAGWRVADKTGTGGQGAVNDIGVLFPAGRAPIVVAVYTTGSRKGPAELEAGLAEVARIVAKALESGEFRSEALGRP